MYDEICIRESPTVFRPICANLQTPTIDTVLRATRKKCLWVISFCRAKRRDLSRAGQQKQSTVLQFVSFVLATFQCHFIPPGAVLYLLLLTFGLQVKLCEMESRPSSDSQTAIRLRSETRIARNKEVMKIQNEVSCLCVASFFGKWKSRGSGFKLQWMVWDTVLFFGNSPTTSKWYFA